MIRKIPEPERRWHVVKADFCWPDDPTAVEANPDQTAFDALQWFRLGWEPFAISIHDGLHLYFKKHCSFKEKKADMSLVAMSAARKKIRNLALTATA